MKRIFISYTLKDKNIDKKFLEDIRYYVCKQGIDCYVDLLDNDYNEEGFQKKLLTILKGCNIFLMIDSCEYVNSKWTQKEIKLAKLLNLNIIKVKFDVLKMLMVSNSNFNSFIKLYNKKEIMNKNNCIAG